jgi:hypothetical protein
MPTPATVLADAFVSIMEALLRSVVAEAQERRMYPPVLAAIQARLQRLGNRFLALLDRYRAGKLRVAEPAPPRPAAAPAADSAPRARRVPDPDSRLPQVFAWLRRLLPESAVWPATALGYVLQDPEVENLIAAAPQAGRILRSFCRMLGVRPPPMLAVPPRPRLQTTPPPEPSTEQSATPVDVTRPSRPAVRPTIIRLGAGELWRRPDSLWPTRELAQRFDAKILVWPDER